MHASSIHYPSYLAHFSEGKRNYDGVHVARLNYKNIHGEEPPDSYEKHHVDLDRTNGKPNNIAFLPKKVHSDLHKQLNKILTQLFRIGFLKYDKENPHYYITDQDVIKSLHIQKIEDETEKPIPIEYY